LKRVIEGRKRKEENSGGRRGGKGERKREKGK